MYEGVTPFVWMCVVFLPESLFRFSVYKIGLLYNRSSYFVCDCWQVRQFPKFVQSFGQKKLLKEIYFIIVLYYVQCYYLIFDKILV